MFLFRNIYKSVTRRVHEVIAIDGKSICGSRDAGNKNIVHMVSARAARNHIVSGQVKADEKSNEIKAIPCLPELLVLKGSIVTIDAMGCPKEIASKMIEKEADYLLALKGTQGNLLECGGFFPLFAGP